MQLRSPIAITNLHIISLTGEVLDRGDCIQAHDPENPGYYHGNCLMLPAPPAAGALPGWIARSRQLFAADPRVGHVCLEWDEGILDPDARAAALSMGCVLEQEVALTMDTPPPERPGELEIRSLSAESDWEVIEALNVAGDGSERAGEPGYDRFKERLRAGWRAMMRAGSARWWGALRSGALVGQCGVIPAGKIGRFQAVETHPRCRRQGICSALIAEVARREMAGGLERMALAADPDGPAIQLYLRLGFRELGLRETLVLGAPPLTVRPERPGDTSSVDSLVRAAFRQEPEVRLVGALRGEPGVISLVADHSGAILGHILFSPVQLEGPEGAWTAVALAPLAVRPSHQRQGIGGELIRAGLRACERAGYGACIVLGHPDYYPRFGFTPARPLGIEAPWPVSDRAWMVMELRPSALDGRRGTVRYHPAFDALG